MSKSRVGVRPFITCLLAVLMLLAQAVMEASGTAPRFDADVGVSAGLKIMADGNVIDGTLAGLLADRADFEARLLRQLELES